MRNGRLKKIPLGDITAQGWLNRQLATQSEGLTGSVSELFKDLSEKSAWLGGKGESWERGPYYVDGLMPLAYLLNDENLKNKCSVWIDAIISSQNEEGFFGPKGNLDWWPRMVVTKMLPSYFEVSKDQRVIPFLLKYYEYMSKNIAKRPLYSWANARGIEELIGIDWLYGVTKEEFLIELGNKIITQSLDWGKEFENFRFTLPSKKYMSSRKFNIKKVCFYAVDFINNFLGKTDMPKEKLLSRNVDSFNLFYHLTHGVNIAMALKYPALIASFTNNEDLYAQSEKGYAEIMMYHGNANGLYTCDEHLSGASPTQGIELCTVAEAMFSMEKLYQCTANAQWADTLELLAFNTFPATFTSDMCAHQYVQQTNQISATKAKRKWYDSYDKANIYGLKPNYACCLSNMHQGFPKFCEHLAFLDGNTIVLLCPVPMKINTIVGGENVDLEIISDYPFKTDAIIKVHKGNPKIRLRIPKRAKSIVINGIRHTGEYIEINAKYGDTVIIEYEIKITSAINSDGSISYYYGNLLLALPIEAKVRMKDKNNKFSDREFYPLSKWNYEITVSDKDLVVKNNIAENPFSTAPLIVKTTGYEAMSWKEENNQCMDVPISFLRGERTNLTLVPYGCTDLRIAQFPHQTKR